MINFYNNKKEIDQIKKYDKYKKDEEARKLDTHKFILKNIHSIQSLSLEIKNNNKSELKKLKINESIQENEKENEETFGSFLKVIAEFKPIIANSQFIGYSFSPKNYKLNKLNAASLFLNYFFFSFCCLISRPIFNFYNNKIEINLFYYFPTKRKFRKKNKFVKRNRLIEINEKKKFIFLGDTLSKLFGQSIEFKFIRLYYPYHDSNILAQIFGLNGDYMKFNSMLDILYFKADIKNPTKLIKRPDFSFLPSFLSGTNIKLGGRLLSQRIIPRYTGKTVQNGSLARNKVQFVEKARFTNKNKRGAYSFTVIISHILKRNY